MLSRAGPFRLSGAALGPPPLNPPPPRGTPPRPPPPQRIPGVRHVVAVASGKGGVGKSTSAVNLAVALSGLGARVGVLDGDVYGPSVPQLLNVADRRPDVDENELITPVENYGVRCMSMGLLVPKDGPMIWRGLMVMSALQQLLTKVQWAPLDVLVVDLPPGTGDAQLTLCQRTPLSGAVIVTTPQEVALAAVRRGVNMFRKLNVPILGLVENMSHHECSSCGHISHPLGSNGGKRTADQFELEMLAQIALDAAVCDRSDNGQPITVVEPHHAASKQFSRAARRILDQLEAMDTKLDGEAGK